jgi:hypothetical protein
LGADAYRQDSLELKRLTEYFLKHHSSWLTFAIEKLGRPLSSADLLFVTGCDKTSDWACAAWSEQTRSAQLKFFASAPGLVEGSANVWGYWQSTQSPDRNVGPRRLVPTVPRSTLPSARSFLSGIGAAISNAISDNETPSSQAASEPSNLDFPPNFNQCVFVRSFRLGDRVTWLRPELLVDLGDGFMTVTRPVLSKKGHGELTTQHNSMQASSYSGSDGLSQAPTSEQTRQRSDHDTVFISHPPSATVSDDEEWDPHSYDVQVSGTPCLNNLTAILKSK